jgi:glutamate/tyrosine decarboxylase-like PLP-dependent enzyme
MRLLRTSSAALNSSFDQIEVVTARWTFNDLGFEGYRIHKNFIFAAEYFAAGVAESNWSLCNGPSEKLTIDFSYCSHR